MFVFPCFSRTMKIHFSHLFGVVWISTSPNIFKKPINLKGLCFPMLFRVLWKSAFPIFWVWGIVWISASREICKKHLTLECSVFPYVSRTIGNHFAHVLGAVPLMWRLMKIFYFWSHFHTNVYVKLFTKEVNLFCSWARPNICISEVWKYIQHRRVGSVFYGSDSIAIFLWIWQLKFV